MNRRIVAWAIDRPVTVIATWIGIFVASIVAIATLLPSALVNTQETTNHPESMRALEVQRDHLVGRSGFDAVLIVASKDHRFGDAEFAEFLGDLVAKSGDVGVTVAGGGSTDLANATPPTSEDGHAIFVPLVVSEGDEMDVAERLVDAARDADEHPDFDVSVTGSLVLDHDLTELSERDLREGELYVGLPVAMLVLLIVFGTFVGALMPIMIAVMAIVCALALAAVIGQQWQQSIFLVNMVSGMGLALGIDYSLFVLSRYREERVAGNERDAAIRTTCATAGRAVLFSGITFVVALTGMLLVQTTIMRSLAAGAILVGITAVAAALTLLPAVLRVLGDRVDAVPVPFIHRRARAGTGRDGAGFWDRLVRRVMRRPILWGGAVTLLLLAASIPLLGMNTGASGVSTFPDDLASRQGFEALRSNFPDQASEPARIVVKDSGGLDQDRLTTAVTALSERLDDEGGYGNVTVAQRADDGQVAIVEVSVGADSLDVAAVQRVRELRDDHIPATLRKELGADAQILVTGETALNLDYFDVMSRWLPIVLAFVLGLSFVVLLVVFRSIVVPAVAIVLNLLSVGATYGLLVLVFQDGVGANLLGFEQVDTTEAWVPLFLFSVLFGLSMDYHMFLMTRIRERWLATGDTQESVAWAVGSTARIITGAALIIVAVFAGFAIGDLVMFQQMGFGIAIALLIDATLVRGVLLPAAMTLLGDHNWYLPRWLKRLPEVQLD